MTLSRIICKNDMNLTVLLVEDSILTSKITKFMLQSLGCNVFAAKDGADAMDIYRKQKDSIDFILLDIEMPIMDGHLLLKNLRKEFMNELCFVCAFSTLINNKNAAQFGFDSFISKPTSNSELLRLTDKVKSFKSKKLITK